MPKFAANLSMMFNEVPFLARFAAAANAGFTGVEYLFPYEYPAELIAAELNANSLENVLFNLGRGIGGFGPFVIGALAVSYSFTVAIALLATIYLLDIVATAFLIPEKRGVPLE